MGAVGFSGSADRPGTELVWYRAGRPNIAGIPIILTKQLHLATSALINTHILILTTVDLSLDRVPAWLSLSLGQTEWRISSKKRQKNEQLCGNKNKYELLHPRIININ